MRNQDLVMSKMDIKKIAVLGLGLMGNGIAHVCAQAGYEVWARDIENSFVENGLKTICNDPDIRVYYDSLGISLQDQSDENIFLFVNQDLTLKLYE